MLEIYVVSGNMSDSMDERTVAAFAASGCGNISEISPAILQISASHHLSLVVSTAAMASSMECWASSNWRSSAWAFAKYGKQNGISTVDPVERTAMIERESVWIAKLNISFFVRRWQTHPSIRCPSVEPSIWQMPQLCMAPLSTSLS